MCKKCVKLNKKIIRQDASAIKEKIAENIDISTFSATQKNLFSNSI